MRPPFPQTSEFLQIYQNSFYQGLNRKNMRDVWFPYADFTLTNTFTPIGGTSPVFGAWTKDSGDLTMIPAEKEGRMFAFKGKASISFTGSCVILRVQLNSSWGIGEIYIDGVKPSTIAGLGAFADTVNCNADSYPGLTKTQCRDFIIADGLSPGNHTLDIYANNAKGGFFVVNGMKLRSYGQRPVITSSYKVPISTALNNNKLTLTNAGSIKTVTNLSLTVPPKIVKTDGTAYPATIEIGTLTPNTSFDLPYTIDSSAEPDNTNYILQFTGNYEDPNGSVVIPISTKYDIDNAVLTFLAGWVKDGNGPGGVRRAFSTSSGQIVSFSLEDTQFDISVVREFGWGGVNVVVGTTVYGTLTSSDPVGGQFILPITFTGLPTGTKIVKLISNSGSPFVFTDIATTATTNYSQVVENIILNYSYRVVPPYPVVGTAIVDGKVTWTPSQPTPFNVNEIRDNTGLIENRVYTRFPTFALHYSSGRNEIKSEYDILIIEPTAVTRKEVRDWQSRGIKVFGYISFGEELGERLSVYDFANTTMRPHIGDGLGPGGYASYFNKGDNNFGEFSECQNDRQRKEDIKGCAVSNPKYYTGIGRCSNACTLDYRDGYVAQSKGGACGGGFTSLNNWKRDAQNACQNSGCPSYSPMHGKCPQFVKTTDSYGQDFSIMTPDYPDQNGIWGSSFINPIKPSWKNRLVDQYFRFVFGQQVVRTEVRILTQTTVSSGVIFGTVITAPPFDPGEPLIVRMTDNSYTFIENLDFSFDTTNGAFVFSQPPVQDPTRPVLATGTSITITYTEKGLECDGVFMDTVDTVDVYSSPVFNTAMANMINELKVQYPTRDFCSNRGFSILHNIIKSCSFVMFESFLADYNWTTNVYKLITNQGHIEYNQYIKDLLRTLRKTNKFDVFGLNYCSNGSDGDEMRKIITDACFKEGYLCWTSTILLDEPLALSAQNVNPNGALRTNLFQTLKKNKVL